MHPDTTSALWIAPELDFEDLYQKEQYEKLIWLSGENENLLRRLGRDASPEALRKTLRLGTLLLSYFERSIQLQKALYAVFCLGKLKGRLESLNEQRFSQEQAQMTQARAQLSTTKYLDQIVSLLELRGAMSQTELCEKLNLQKSTLSEALKRIRETHMVQAQLCGKYKVYSLTDQGVGYAALLRRNKSRRPDIEETLKALTEHLQNDATKAATIYGLRDLLRSDGTAMVALGQPLQLSDDKNHVDAKFNVQQVMEVTNTASGDGCVTLCGNFEEINVRDFVLESREMNEVNV